MDILSSPERRHALVEQLGVVSRRGAGVHPDQKMSVSHGHHPPGQCFHPTRPPERETGESVRARDIALAAWTVAVVATLVVPEMVLALFLLPGRTCSTDCTMRLSVSNGETRMVFGTPHRAVDLVLSDRLCGIERWGDPWQSTTATVVSVEDPSSPGLYHHYGMDVVVIGWTRWIVPIRYTTTPLDATTGAGAASSDVVPTSGTVGLCPTVVEDVWGMSPTYSARCSGLCAGSGCQTLGAGECRKFEDVAVFQPAQIREERFAAPWALETCLSTVPSRSDNGTGAMLVVDPVATQRSSLANVRSEGLWSEWLPCGTGHDDEDVSTAWFPSRCTDDNSCGMDSRDGVHAATSTDLRNPRPKRWLWTCIRCGYARETITLLAVVAIVIWYGWTAVACDGGGSTGGEIHVAMASYVCTTGIYGATVWRASRSLTESEGAAAGGLATGLITLAVFGPILADLTSALIRRRFRPDPTTVVVPLLLALWFATFTEESALARAMLVTGTGLLASVSAAEIATRRVHQAITCTTPCDPHIIISAAITLATASLVVGIVYSVGLFPVLATYFGDAVPMRILFAAVPVSAICTTSVAIAAKRTM